MEIIQGPHITYSELTSGDWEALEIDRMCANGILDDLKHDGIIHEENVPIFAVARDVANLVLGEQVDRDKAIAYVVEFVNQVNEDGMVEFNGDVFDLVKPMTHADLGIAFAMAEQMIYQHPKFNN